ncbi:MAG: helix-turn-helix domain-containing protein [Nanoarchaeota archaeon]|nr:helix-turn-helix domain-containing protein [Nanoarchaeota archaeon]
MWVTKLKIKHDCTIGDRCERFKCISYSMPLGNWHDKNYEYTSERHTIEGNEKNVREFLKNLKKDERIINLEISKNTVFFIGKRKKEKIPTSHWNQKIFFIKPVFVDKEGYEYWEIASWKREVITKFIKNLEKEKELKLDILKIQKVKLDDIHFPHIMPKLSPKQKRAFELAVEYGYYKFPRKVGLEKLAKIMKVSVSTLQEHLRKAEEKIIPSFK